MYRLAPKFYTKTMKKLLFAVAFVATGLANAQSFGLTGGVAVFNAKAEAPGYSESDSQTGGYVGFFGEFNLDGSLNIAPGINYLFAEDTNALQIPVMLKYYVDPKFNLAFGPQLMFDLAEVPAGMDQYYNRFNFGLALGAGYNFTQAFGVEARYGFQLNDHIKGAAKDAGASAKINTLNVGLNYKFK